MLFPDRGATVNLVGTPRELTPTEITLTPSELLPVLSKSSGVCFVVGHRQAESEWNESQMIIAKAIGKFDFDSIPFKAIAIGVDGKEYDLTGASLGDGDTDAEGIQAVVCKQFCPCSRPPKSVKQVRITALRPIRVQTIHWRTDPDVGT
jgi:hypothetical protein